MYKKQFFLTVITSSLLTMAVLAAFLAWGRLATAQDSGAETGEGFVAPVSSGSTDNEAIPAFSPAAEGSTTGEGLTDAAAPTTPATLDTPLATQASMSHWFILGSHLLGRGSGMQYAYGGNGCMYVTNSNGIIRMQFPVSLPDGAVIKSMDVFYYDTSASDLTVWLTTYDPGTTNLDIATASSTGTAGLGSASSAEVTHTVDNGIQAYSLNYSWGGVEDSTLQICGVRINYIDPFYASFLPTALKE